MSGPEGWAFCFGVYVRDNEGLPCEGLKKGNFSVWQLTTVTQTALDQILELFVDFPTSKMPGIYRLQTKRLLGITAPHPQEFVFALRAHVSKQKETIQGFTTVPITYLGDWH
jgi:hypothetical protein